MSENSLCHIITQFDDFSEHITEGRDLNQQERQIIFFHSSGWYHRPGGPAEGAECCAADAPGQSGP